MKVLYNFVEADTGFDIGNLNQLELGVCPRAGEFVAFWADGQSGEALYIVEQVTHRIGKVFLTEDLAHIVDVSIKPVVAVN